MEDQMNREQVVVGYNADNDVYPTSVSRVQEGQGRSKVFNTRPNRRTVLKTGLGLAVVAAGAGTWFRLYKGAIYAKQQTDNVVIQWNNAALQAIGDTATGPTVGARALAIVHTCMYDAWSVYDSVAVPTRSNGIPRQKDKWKDVTEAVCYAAYRALIDLFPGEASVFNTLLSDQGYSPSTSTDLNTPAGIGNVAAQAVLTFRHTDGSNQLGDLHPGAYSDYTGYTPTAGNPDLWQPIGTQSFLTPHWKNVTPFALSSASQFRPSGPLTTGQPGFQAQVDAVLQLSAQLNDTSKVIAEYWADGPHSSTPPGHWDLLSQFVSAQLISRKNKHDLSGDIKMFFALTNAIFDASIAAWECKRYYNSCRPITAVHTLYAGKQITAWGGPGKGTQTLDGNKWNTYIKTPPFPEYVSGHSTFSATGAYILKQVTGSDSFGDSYTAAKGSSTVEPNTTPANSVTLSWPTFSAAAVEAGMSRRYGGIHFQKADEDGRALGNNVAPQAWAKAQQYINGTAG